MKREGTAMRRREFCFVMAATLLAGCASRAPATAERAEPTPGPTFSETERKIIEAFYGKPSGPLAASSAKPGNVLDSGLRPAKLPSDLLARLPDLPAPYTRYILGADVVLVNRDTHAILDVIPQIVH